MSENEHDILQLRFEGNGISPSTVNPSEIADLIQQFEKALAATIKKEHQEIDTREVLFVLDSIKNESLGINFIPLAERIIPQVKQAVIASYFLITTAISTNDYSKLPLEATQSLKKIAAFSKEKQCNGNFNYNGETLGTITPTTDIKEVKAISIKSSLNIYGEIIDIGSNIHIRLNEGYNVIVDADKTVSKLLAPKLWEIVGLRGIAKWDIDTFKITEFKLTEILDYNPSSLSEAFNNLKSTTSGWDKFNNNDDINKQLFRD